METLLRVVLQNRDCIIAAFDEQVDRLRPEKRRIKPVEKDRASTSLSVSNLSDEDRFRRRLAPAIKLEITIAKSVNDSLANRLGSSGERHIASRVGGPRHGAEFASFLVHNSFAAYDDHIFL